MMRKKKIKIAMIRLYSLRNTDEPIDKYALNILLDLLEQEGAGEVVELFERLMKGEL